MRKTVRTDRWIGWIALAILTGAMLAGCGPEATPITVTLPPEVPGGNSSTLQQQVVAQETRIAALEAQSQLAQLVASQATQIAVLETRVAGSPQQPGALAPTVVPPSAPPTATVVPPVAGLTMEGVAKGAANAKVTITEFVDYF